MADEAEKAKRHHGGMDRRGFLWSAAGMVASLAASPLGRADEKAPQNKFSPEDEKLLDMVQQQTLRFFTHHSPADSGMALERSNWIEEKEYHGKALLATGGTGFGIMALVAGAKRGEDEFRKTGRASGNWPSKRKALEQISTIVKFLDTKVTRYHGIFPHWVEPDGKTFTPPWSPAENGGDLVETSFLMMGLLCAREYLKKDPQLKDDPQAKAACETINKLWREADWKWHTKNGTENKLYWHWSPDREWAMNQPIRGWNEGLAAYILGASAPDPEHRISPEVYHEGWASRIDKLNAQPANKKEPEDITALQYQYSMAAIDPHGLKDRHLEKDCADYWEQGRRHMMNNWKHCADNPHGHAGYGPDCWGLSECDGPESKDPDRNKYQPRSPKRDDGTIATGAAGAAIDYLPEQSMAAMRRFARDPNIWDECGPVDSFNLRPDNNPDRKPWYDRDSKGKPVYIAIHQLPISVMVENYRSRMETGQGYLWELFMQCPEVKQGLQNLGFSTPHLEVAQRVDGKDAPQRSR